MALATARASLVTALHAASGDRHAQSAMRAHRVLRLHEPAVEEVAAYRKSGGRANARLICAESLLRLRGKPIAKGGLEAGRAFFADEVKRMLCDGVKAKDAGHWERFDELALSFSRLIAVHYRDGRGRQPERVDRELRTTLPHLAGHLMAELELHMEAKFARPANNLCKVSVFDIQTKLGTLESHADKVVRDHARTIVYAALHAGNLELADALAEGAKAKLGMLESHADEIVRKYAKTIVCAALRSGDLELAGVLAKGARVKLDALQSHADKAARDNAEAIICAALRYGNLKLADRLAKGAADALDGLKEALGDERGAETQLSMMLSAGTLDVKGFLKAAA